MNIIVNNLFELNYPLLHSTYNNYMYEFYEIIDNLFNVNVFTYFKELVVLQLFGQNRF